MGRNAVNCHPLDNDRNVKHLNSQQLWFTRTRSSQLQTLAMALRLSAWRVEHMWCEQGARECWEQRKRQGLKVENDGGLG